MLPESTDHPNIINGATKVEGRDYTTKLIFSVEGRDGLWRRVPRSATGIKVTREGAILTHRGDDLVECVPYHELNELLEKCGYGLPEDAATKPAKAKDAKTNPETAKKGEDATTTNEGDSEDHESDDAVSEQQGGTDSGPIDDADSTVDDIF